MGQRPHATIADNDFRICPDKRLLVEEDSGGLPDHPSERQRRDAKRGSHMVRNGVPDRVALDVAGIKTRAILDRYNITSDSDKRAALEAVKLPTASADGRG